MDQRGTISRLGSRSEVYLALRSTNSQGRTSGDVNENAITKENKWCFRVSNAFVVYFPFDTVSFCSPAWQASCLHTVSAEILDVIHALALPILTVLQALSLSFLGFLWDSASYSVAPPSWNSLCRLNWASNLQQPFLQATDCWNYSHEPWYLVRL